MVVGTVAVMAVVVPAAGSRQVAIGSLPGAGNKPRVAAGRFRVVVQSGLQRLVALPGAWQVKTGPSYTGIIRRRCSV